MALLQDIHYNDRTMNDYTPIVVGTASGSIASFNDAIEGRPFKSITANIELTQDLHGYDHPWPGGGGKNIFYIPSTTHTGVGVTYVYDADTNTLTKSGTSTGNTGQNIGSLTVPAGTYTFSAVFEETGTPTRLYLRDAATDTNLSYIDASTTSRSYTLDGTYYFRVASEAGETGGTISNIQLEPGSTATSYEPYSNICPISGWTSATVTRTGVNVWDEEWEVGDIDSNTGRDKNSTSVIRSKNYTAVKPSTPYYFHIGGENQKNWKSRFYDADMAYIGTGGTLQNNAVFTTPSNAAYVRFALQTAYGTTYNHDISINYPSTDHDYEPYQGESITIQLGQTVYGGTVEMDVVNGKLTVDRAINVLNGTQTFGYIAYGDGSVQVIYTPMPAKAPAPSTATQNNGLLSDRFTTSSPYTDGPCQMTGRATNGGIYINMPSTVTTGAQARSWFADNPTQVIYELATPIEIPLTAQQLTTLLGDNNVWTDTGDTTVEYWIEFWLNTQTTLLQDIHYTDNNFWTDLLNCWNTKNYARAVRLLEENQELTSKYVNAAWFNLLTNNIYYLETQSDPSFKNDKIQVGYDLPTDISIGSVFFELA